MKMYLISDNIDTQIGMRLVGIDGCVAHDSETITAEIKKAVNDPELGILIFTEKAAAMVKEYLNHLKITLHTPLIMKYRTDTAVAYCTVSTIWFKSQSVLNFKQGR
ncbi:MAG: V-type ATP synthase subunit F [Hominilimicola sp.]